MGFLNVYNIAWTNMKPIFQNVTYSDINVLLELMCESDYGKVL